MHCFKKRKSEQIKKCDVKKEIEKTEEREKKRKSI